MGFYPLIEKYGSILNRNINDMDISIKKAVDVLDQAKDLRFVSLDDLAFLIFASRDKHIRSLIIDTAKFLTDKVFGNRVVIFISLYYSTFCRNDCLYCGYRKDSGIFRKITTKQEFEREVVAILNRGFSRIELVSGVNPYYDSDKVGELISLAKKLCGRAIFSNIGFFERADDYRGLKEGGLDGWILFMETYHRDSYIKYHPDYTPKGEFEHRLTSYDLAAKAGINTIGLGVLLGLYDWRFELLAIVDHARYLKQRYNSIISFSVPRMISMEGIIGSRPYDVFDGDFLLYIALLRIGFPFASIAISTRETREMRKKALDVAGTSTRTESSTSMDGYSTRYTDPQFPNNEIILDETLEDIFSIGKVPSFCTACSEMNIDSEEFYSSAKSGKLKRGCMRNAILSCSEFFKRDISKSHTIYDFREDKLLVIKGE